MNLIKMKRSELLKIIYNNRVKHVELYEESVADYKQLVLQISQSNLKLAKTGDLAEFAKIKSLPAAPVSYEDSYRRAERMFELSVDDVIEIDESLFNQLVLDEWQWKKSFVTSGMLYKSAH